MPRAERSFEEGRIYHVYNRVGGGSIEFADDELAATFITFLRLVMRHDEVVRIRELIGLVGIERYGVKVTELAAELGKSRDGVGRWYRRGVDRREADPRFAAAAEALDRAASQEA